MKESLIYIRGPIKDRDFFLKTSEKDGLTIPGLTDGSCPIPIKTIRVWDKDMICGFDLLLPINANDRTFGGHEEILRASFSQIARNIGNGAVDRDRIGLQINRYNEYALLLDTEDLRGYPPQIVWQNETIER